MQPVTGPCAKPFVGIMILSRRTSQGLLVANSIVIRMFRSTARPCNADDCKASSCRRGRAVFPTHRGSIGIMRCKPIFQAWDARSRGTVPKQQSCGCGCCTRPVLRVICLDMVQLHISFIIASKNHVLATSDMKTGHLTGCDRQ